MIDIIDKYKLVVIQIATPFSTGTGFYSNDFDLIVTNEHVIRDNQRVVIDGESFDKQLVDVVYVDPKYDLAFLRPPDDHALISVSISKEQSLRDGDTILAIGHPFGLHYTTTKGIVSNSEHTINGVNFVQHDAALNPGNSGGPLINSKGEVSGVNTFIIKDGNNIGFSLSAQHLTDTLKAFKAKDIPGVRCLSCSNLVFEDTKTENYCPHCGTDIKFIRDIILYEPHGIKRAIEHLLTDIGQDVELSRRGPKNWEVKQGSAKISISYFEKSGLIIGDSYLCTLPKTNILKIYRYLLQQNHDLEGLTFSVKEMDIVLSVMIYDQYLNEDTGKLLLRNLFEKSDYFDDILVNEYGANWKKEPF